MRLDRMSYGRIRQSSAQFFRNADIAYTIQLS
jgi:hypothetical protein